MHTVNRSILETLIGDFWDHPFFNRKHLFYTAAVIVLIACVVMLVIVFNWFAHVEQDVFSAQSNLAGAVQMRTNLLPVFISSVDTFKGYEKSVVLETTKLRSGNGVGVGDEKWNALLEKAGDLKNLERADRLSQSLLDKISVVAEAYPQLKASEPFLLLMSKITETELVIFEARQKYNMAVNLYEKDISTFPNSLAARLFGFKKLPYYSSVEKPEWDHPAAGSMGGEKQGD